MNESAVAERRKAKRSYKNKTYIGLGLRSPDILPISISFPLSKRTSLQLFAAPPFYEENKADCTYSH